MEIKMSWKSISRKKKFINNERTIEAKKGTKTNPPVVLPVVLAEWPQNGHGVVRLTLTEYKGHKRLDLRSYYYAKGGDLRPSRNGVVVPFERLSEVRKGLRKAKELAEELGLITRRVP
jgi:hypothetical protein